MHHQTLASTRTVVSNALRRLPWALDRSVQRYVLGRRDHRDAVVMASAEPVVWLRVASSIVLAYIQTCIPRLMQVLSAVSNGVGTVTLNR